MVSSLGLVFGLIYLRLDTGEAGNLKLAMCTAQKRFPESSASYKGPGKEQCSKTENFQTVTALFKPNTTGKAVAPAPYSQLAEWGDIYF